MTVVLAVVFSILGLAVGSFLNVCIDRLPRKKSVVSVPSHCDSCGHRLGILDLVPLASYFLLRGRCRYCHARIPRRVVLVEFLGGVVFLTAFLRFGLSPAFVLSAFWSCVFLIIIFIDWEHQLILNRVTYPMAGVALLILAIDSAMPRLSILGNLILWPEAWPGIVSGILGGAIGFGFFLAIHVISPRGMGMGDVKLAGLIGLVCGLPLVGVALLVGILAGGLTAGVMLALKVKHRKDVMPYGTFLGIGPIITLFWGAEIFRWYLGLFGLGSG
ncbi:MAG: prepilin peptidase [Dehalococcoidales bacterium]|nr:prepilin peptidase [Dehalococcoidales bacterium]